MDQYELDILELGRLVAVCIMLDDPVVNALVAVIWKEEDRELV